MTSPRILPADHPDVPALTAAGWRVVQESWAAQAEATDEARRRWEEAAAVVKELGAFRPLTVDDVPAALALDATGLYLASPLKPPLRLFRGDAR